MNSKCIPIIRLREIVAKGGRTAMKKNRLEAVVKALKKQKLVIAYCCCGTKKTSSTAC